MKAILFDFDGTLVDSIAAIIESYRSAFFDHDMPYPGDKEIASLIGVGLDVIIGRFVPEEAVAAVSESYRNHYLLAQRKGVVQLFPEVKSHLTALQQASYKLGIVTSKLHRFALEFLQEHELESHFSVVIGAEDVTHKKPHPEPLLTAAAASGLAPEQCLYVGDTVHDGQAARAAQMLFVGVLTGTGSAAELAEFGSVFRDIGELRTKLLNGTI